MKIDWFTVIAQIVNFLILVFLLRRFLYKPILNAIKEREQKIATQLKDSNAKMAVAKKEQDEFKQKNDVFDKQKSDMMAKVVSDADAERQKLLEEARTQANALSAKIAEASKKALEHMNSDIVQRTQDEVFAISRKTLSDLASAGLEEQSVKIFIARLNELKDDEKKKFIADFKTDQNPVLISSAFDLPVKIHDEIKKAVDHILGPNTKFEFKTAPELISGIELTTKGYKLGWNISEYLSSMEKSIAELVKENNDMKPAKKPAKKATKKTTKNPA